MAEERVQRRLAAIIVADIVGYSKMMEEDEAGTLARLKSLRTEFFPKIEEHGGRIVKTTGDGTLIEFGSAVDAVSHAVEFQRGLAEWNADFPENQQFHLRMGINVGDIIIDEGDIFGDGVNIAARLEALAEPDGVFISQRVYDYVRGRIDVAFEDLGEQQVKNISEPVRVYRIRMDAGDPDTVDSNSETQSTLNKPSIAVLPFDNLSGDPEQEYFSDGIVEDIITGLSRIHWFFVTARNSSFAYKGKSIDIRRIGRELGVRYVLEGSVRKGGNRIRINAQLIVAETGNHLWAERFDGELADIFDLQDRITAQVVGAIEPSLQEAEIERSSRKRTSSLTAYDLYLRALPHVWTHTPTATNIALELLKAAVEIDPAYATVHALLARGYQQKFLRAGNDPADRALSIKHARAVLALRSDDPTALSLAGLALAYLDNDFENGRNAIDKALELNPNSAQALGISALINTISGRHDYAVRQAEQSIRLSPLDPVRYMTDAALSYAHFAARRFAEAAEAARHAIQSNAQFIPGHVMLAAAQFRLGQIADAQNTARRILELEPHFRFGVSIAMVASGQPDDAENVRSALRELDLVE